MSEKEGRRCLRAEVDDLLDDESDDHGEQREAAEDDDGPLLVVPLLHLAAAPRSPPRAAALLALGGGRQAGGGAALARRRGHLRGGAVGADHAGVGAGRHRPHRAHPHRVVRARVQPRHAQLHVAARLVGGHVAVLDPGELHAVLQRLRTLQPLPRDQALAVIDAGHSGRALQGRRGSEGGLEGEHRGEGALACLGDGAQPVAVLRVLGELADLVRVVVTRVDLLPLLPAVLGLEDVSGAQLHLGVPPPQLQLVVTHIETLQLWWRRGQRSGGHF